MSTVDPWLVLLERFERDLDVPAEAIGLWDPVELTTPLPVHLFDRARQIIARQEQRMAQVRAELAATRAHLDAVGLVLPPRGDTAAYVDRDG